MITYYKIMFRNSAGTDFYEQTTDCDGRDATIVAALTCTIPMGTLSITPFELEHGTSIFVQVIAGNEFGDSDASVPGNGGIMVEVPSTPVLTNDFANTNL